MRDSTVDDRLARWAFFRQWLKNPLGVAAVSPSSPQLARQMIAALPTKSTRLIELGGGTGAITEQLLRHGIAPADLMVLELNEAMHQTLRQRFPDIHLHLANAADVQRIARESGFLGAGPADAVVSGLGLLSMPRPLQRDIVSEAFACLRPDGRFVQFTYGPASPVAREVLDDLKLTSRRASFTWWNVPPATVYVYERQRSTAVQAQPMGRRAG
ncbi:class I SAM-dependent methyltransferase [Silanimonas sp.]|jgi:phospholipid N-methyltransferase|uniref:class I SAM-dependent methyltransferase n=1 Tax=Silanimonas sp. TaxID=1929290 RepID=UPI0037C7A06C